jgi:beta-1,4-mannosyltransferase
VIDWHNFSHAMLGLHLSPRHALVRVLRWSERAVGSRADAHLCVSRALQTELADTWGIRASVLYDRPASRFRPTPLLARHDLFGRLADVLNVPALPPFAADPLHRETGPLRRNAEGRKTRVEETTLLTERFGSPAREPSAPAAAACENAGLSEAETELDVRLRADRPAVLVSATSWTADEDFELLLAALARLDEALQTKAGRREHAPSVLMLITGDGPLRLPFEQQLRGRRWQHVCVRTLWLSAEDYPLLLGSADMGVCVHRSASGLDLPMKILDMYGAGLPVCAFDYGVCIRELVRHEETGLLFSNAAQLADQLFLLFAPHPKETPLLRHMRRQVAQARHERWEDLWTSAALPLLRDEIPA